MRKHIWSAAILLASIQTAHAGGYMVGEMSARAGSMASAFTAIANDASAAWYNPAGVAFTHGKQVMLGTDLILTHASFSTNASNPKHPASSNAKSGSFLVPHGYFTYWDDKSSIGAALGVNAPFGLETSWPDTAPFASKSTFSRLNMVMVNPSVVFKVSDTFSIALGADYGYMKRVDFNTTIQDTTGSGDGWGGNASLMYQGDHFNIGVTYRSKIKVAIHGSATAKGQLAGIGAITGATTSSANTSVTLPDQLNIGLAYKPNNDWTLSADIDWVNWKRYKSLDITYASAAYRAAVKTLQGAVGAPATGATSIPENWKATIAFKLGAEWAYNPHMRARFGYAFDPTPINNVDFSPSIPGNDRHLFSVGYGYDFNETTTLDLGYMYVYILNRHQTQSPATPARAPNSVKNGDYKNNAHVIMASLSHRF